MRNLPKGVSENLEMMKLVILIEVKLRRAIIELILVTVDSFLNDKLMKICKNKEISIAFAMDRIGRNELLLIEKSVNTSSGSQGDRAYFSTKPILPNRFKTKTKAFNPNPI